MMGFNIDISSTTIMVESEVDCRETYKSASTRNGQGRRIVLTDIKDFVVACGKSALDADLRPGIQRTGSSEALHGTNSASTLAGAKRSI